MGIRKTSRKRSVRSENVPNISRFGTLPGYLKRPENILNRERFRIPIVHNYYNYYFDMILINYAEMTDDKKTKPEKRIWKNDIKFIPSNFY